MDVAQTMLTNEMNDAYVANSLLALFAYYFPLLDI